MDKPIAESKNNRKFWGYLKNRLGKENKEIKTELWQKVQEIWYNTIVETSSASCRKAIDSMPNRINNVLKNNAGHSGY